MERVGSWDCRERIVSRIMRSPASLKLAKWPRTSAVQDVMGVMIAHRRKPGSCEKGDTLLFDLNRLGGGS